MTPLKKKEEDPFNIYLQVSDGLAKCLPLHYIVPCLFKHEFTAGKAHGCYKKAFLQKMTEKEKMTEISPYSYYIMVCQPICRTVQICSILFPSYFDIFY